MRFVIRFSWFLTLLMAVAAALRLLNLWLSSGASAPQYAAEASGIMVMVLVPYVFTRALQGMRGVTDVQLVAAAQSPAAPAADQSNGARAAAAAAVVAVMIGAGVFLAARWGGQAVGGGAEATALPAAPSNLFEGQPANVTNAITAAVGGGGKR